MRKARTVFKKQVLDTFKNKTVFIQIVMMPTMAFIMTNAVKINNMSHNFFVLLFASMYIGMAPTMSMASIIAEEKENSTLKVLLMSNVKPWEYLTGVGSYIWSVCMLGALAFALIGTYEGKEFIWFLIIMAIGILISVIIGAVIGTASKNQMMSISLSLPVMMVFSFVPMISMFNDTINKIGSITYSQQAYNLLNNINELTMNKESGIVFICTIVISCVLFGVAYKRSGLS